MAEAHSRQTWQVASSLMALIATCHSGQRFHPHEFNPHARPRPIPASAGVVGDVLGRL